MKPPSARPERLTPAPRRLADDRGVVMLEFLLAFVPVFVLFLGIFQLALLLAAKIVVRHAAVTAVRSAVVVLDDDPRHYGGAERRRITGAATPVQALAQGLATELGLGGDLASGPWRTENPRLAAIRSAAHLPLTAIAPGAQSLLRLTGLARTSSAATAIADGPASRWLLGLTLYLPTATAVTFPRSAGSAVLQVDEVTADPVVVRVTHVTPCTVPIVNRLICTRLRWDATERRLRAPGASAATRAALDELRHAPDAARQWAFEHSTLPCAVLQGEASMPAQWADYGYPIAREP